MASLSIVSTNLRLAHASFKNALSTMLRWGIVLIRRVMLVHRPIEH